MVRLERIAETLERLTACVEQLCQRLGTDHTEQKHNQVLMRGSRSATRAALHHLRGITAALEDETGVDVPQVKTCLERAVQALRVHDEWLDDLVRQPTQAAFDFQVAESVAFSLSVEDGETDAKP